MELKSSVEGYKKLFIKIAKTDKLNFYETDGLFYAVGEELHVLRIAATLNLKWAYSENLKGFYVKIKDGGLKWY